MRILRQPIVVYCSRIFNRCPFSRLSFLNSFRGKKDQVIFSISLHS